MKVIITKEEDVNVVKIIGRLDTITATELDKETAPLIAPNTNVIFDCIELDYISSSGLRMILMVHKKLTSIGGTLTMKDVSPTIKSVFDMTGFTSILRFA